jgi:murein DD-endopeptidase MepM/ murein hydrolase activator NlpD
MMSSENKLNNSILSQLKALRSRVKFSRTPQLGFDGQPLEKHTLMERLRSTYRLTITNPETFEEMGSFNLSLLSVYTAISSALVLFLILFISLIVFTPIKRYIPGYGDTAQLEEMSKLQGKLDGMESMIEANQTYTDKFRAMLTDNVETVKEAPKEDVTAMSDSLLNVGAIEEEMELRSDFEANGGSIINQLNSAQNNVGTAKSTSFVSRDKPLEEMFFVSPLNGDMIKGMRPSEQHFGVDIVAPKNTPIKAAMDGVVIAADFTAETGNSITIMHNNNVVSMYKHNSSLLKKVGQFVKAGEAIAIIGNTGTLTTGPHLHFELWYKGRAMDPTEYINFK